MPKYSSQEHKLRADAAIEQAKKFIAKERGPWEERLQLAKDLAGFNEISYARKVLLRADLGKLAYDSLSRLELEKKLALWTYKDQELPLDTRLADADKMLEELLVRTDELPADPGLFQLRQDALGIRGAIYKVRWVNYGSRESLLRSLEFYLMGYRMGMNADAGAYTAVNAAFVLDALAGNLASGDDAATSRRAEAEKIRNEVIAYMKPLLDRENFKPDQWYYAKLAESYLGTGQYKAARNAAVLIADAHPANWELETAARQFSHLARLQATKEGKPDDQLEASVGRHK